jgi:hypothetical protein
MTNGGIRIEQEEKVTVKLPDFWKAEVTEYDGENEYRTSMFIRGAATEEDALKEARYQAEHWYAEGCTLEPTLGPDHWQENQGYRLLQLEGIQKIGTLEELLLTLFVVDFKEVHDEH